MDFSFFDSPRNVSNVVANVERARAAGMNGYWIPQVMNADTMVTLGVAASQVPEIGLGTSVMANDDAANDGSTGPDSESDQQRAAHTGDRR